MSEIVAPATAAASGLPTEVEPLRIRLPSPIGDVGLELRGTAATRVVIAPEGKERSLFLPFDEVPGSDFLDEVFGRLSEYFAGARPSPDLEYDLGPSGVTGFAKRVLKETAKIPYGKTRTYRRIATAAGRPDAYRMVLSTLVINPLPIVIPCHRVVTNKSGIGSYIAGQERKRWLLEMERQGLAGTASY
jgi:methylated-DNA-[protein]-cysteine S-methyltransferase